MKCKKCGYRKRGQFHDLGDHHINSLSDEKEKNALLKLRKELGIG